MKQVIQMDCTDSNHICMCDVWKMATFPAIYTEFEKSGPVKPGSSEMKQHFGKTRWKCCIYVFAHLRWRCVCVCMCVGFYKAVQTTPNSKYQMLDYSECCCNSIAKLMQTMRVPRLHSTKAHRRDLHGIRENANRNGYEVLLLQQDFWIFKWNNMEYASPTDGPPPPNIEHWIRI